MKEQKSERIEQLEQENKILKEALIQTEEVVRKNIDFYLHKMSFQDVQQDHLEYQYWSEKCKKIEDIRKIIEQAKESLNENRN